MVTIMTEPKTQRCQKKTEILTFRELEVPTSLRLTRFLTLYLTGITCHESFCLQSRFVLGVDLHQCAGDCQTQSFCLTFESATVQISLDIIFLRYTQFLQRLLNHVLENRTREINVQLTTVNRDVTGTFLYIYACHSGLTTT